MANTPFQYPCDRNKDIYISWINHENADGTRMAPGYHQKSILGCSCYTSCINISENLEWVDSSYSNATSDVSVYIYASCPVWVPLKRIWSHPLDTHISDTSMHS